MMRSMKLTALAAAAVLVLAACDGDGDGDVATPMDEASPAVSPITDGTETDSGDTDADAGDDESLATPLPEEGQDE
jgi:ABC-type glycerol-3-phosphate transport system substrate-binding protein